jgi:exosortase/archaeosortase family protein
MKAEEITGRYIVYYFASILVFYQLFMFLPSTWIELLTARITSRILNMFGLNSEYGINNLVWMTLIGGPREIRVYIIRECTAYHVWGILLGLILPLQGPDLGRKIKAVTFGGALVFLMNITRIIATVYLTGYDVPPFSWVFVNPTIETYHYPISFAYGVIGIVIVISLINTYLLPELGDFLVILPNAVATNLREVLKMKKA